ncbi:hypothetical protein BN1708_011059 [Verticillium longisporum]|uniref:Uncharacterized protein n=1 Tax=Verticillium longisporum TaxID=100787 RepID=A0A0G4KWH3_VERLO|nr:hypothetical protein BN1708_011059 [Verticillium longisporum]
MRSLAPAAAHLQMARALVLDRLLSMAYDWKGHGSLLTNEPRRLTTQNDAKRRKTTTISSLGRNRDRYAYEAARSMKKPRAL